MLRQLSANECYGGRRTPSIDTLAFPSETTICFLLPGLKPFAERGKRWGNPRFGRWRRRLKQSRTRKNLLQCLNTAVEQGEVDASVFGAAKQICGYNRWWETLLTVHDMQEKLKVETFGIHSRIFLTAIASCLRQRSLPEEILANRKTKGLQLGQSTWEAMPLPASEFDFEPAISSAWHLCSAIGPDALPWAIEIAEWSETIPLEKGIFAYTNLLSMFEQCGQHSRVDDILDHLAQSGKVSPNEVLLGNLVNEAGMLHDWRRAEHLWDVLVQKFGVEPNCICYVALAKAHLLAGRPETAICKLDAMAAAGIGSGNGHAAMLHLQALLIVCHSMPSEKHLSVLAQFMKRTASLNHTDWGWNMQKEWKKMRHVGRKLGSNSSSVTFGQILCQDNARRYGIMPDHPAGSQYLKEEP